MRAERRPAGLRWAAAGLLALLLAGGGLAAWQRLNPRIPTPFLLRQAIAASEAKDHAQAARLLDELLARDPANSLALLCRGETARELGDEQAAEKFWALVPDEPPREGGTARFLEGLLAFSRHRGRDAERLLLRATELHPSYLPPRERLVQLFLLQLRDAEMRRQMAAIREIRPLSFTELVFSPGNMGKIHPISQRTRQLETLVAADDRDVHSLLALADCRFADDQFTEAINLLDRSLQAYPGDLAVRGRLAEMLVQRHELERAREILERVPPAADAPVALLRGHGAFRSAIGDWPAAVELLDRALQCSPDHLPTTYNFGQALEHVGRHDEASRLLKRGRLMERAVLQLWRLESDDLQKVELKFPVAVEIGGLLMELGRFHDATAWFEQALEWNPHDEPARALYARAVERARSEPPLVLAGGPSTSRAEGPDRLENAVLSLPIPPAWRSRKPAVAAHVADRSPESLPRMKLVDEHTRAGVEFQYQNGAGGSKLLLETLGGGVAAFDFDGDGWPDLYFTQGRPLAGSPEFDDSLGDGPWRDRLYQNLGGSFRDVTNSAGLGDGQYSQGCSAGDFNNDGFVDLAVANFGANVLYRNNGDGTFGDVTLSAAIVGEHWSSSLAFADLDRDGNLDLYVVTYVLEPFRICRPTPDRIATCSPLNFKAEQDQLFRNCGDGRFEDISASAGILAEEGKGLGIVVADLDDDGWPDIYITNDGTPNFLFHNQTAQIGAPLRFEERGLVSGAGVNANGNSQAGMGIACGDFDGDGWLDLYVTNFYNETGTLYRNEGNLLFVDATRAAGLDEPTRAFLGFGTQAIDVDLDGRLDLFIANGHIDDFSFRGEPWKMRPQLFFNLGDAKFAEVSRACGEYFDGEYLGRGAARLDWNRDGRPDLVVVHQDRPAALLSNETPKPGSRLVLDLYGVESNRDAIGARIKYTCGGSTRIHEICGGDGFFASNERRVILGLGAATIVESLEIRWPCGLIDRWTDIPAETAMILIEGRPPVLRLPGVPLLPEDRRD